jgi:hypothetical protein
MFVSDVHDVAGQTITVQTCTVVHLKIALLRRQGLPKTFKRIKIKNARSLCSMTSPALRLTSLRCIFNEHQDEWSLRVKKHVHRGCGTWGFSFLCASLIVESFPHVLVQISTFGKIRFSLVFAWSSGLRSPGFCCQIFFFFLLLLMGRCCAVGRRVIGVFVRLALYLSAIKWREAKWIGHILLRKCLIQQLIWR